MNGAQASQKMAHGSAMVGNREVHAGMRKSGLQPRKGFACFYLTVSCFAFPVTVINSMVKGEQGERKALFQPTGHNPSGKEVRGGGQAGTRLKAGPRGSR